MSPQNRSLRRYPVVRSPESSLDSGATADRSNSYADVAAHFGPRSLPLFYTALERPPDRLVWETQAISGPCRVAFGCCKADGALVPMASESLPAESAPSWPLAGIATTPGIVYAWSVETEREEGMGSASAIGRGNGARGGPGDWKREEEPIPDSPFLEGRFWTLDAGKAARLAQGQQILAQGTEPEFSAIAQALMLAELGLYQAALRHIQRDSSAQARLARALLGHMAQALVYAQMVQQLEREAGQVPAHFRVWARNREAYHRQQAETRSENSSGAASAAAARFLDLF